ncbi:MAG TPA: hypothetical protein ENN40_04435 [Candidatus Aminicenantes bacterium]|nr:hypothetical protein [Candidatus Aminicenantes bacterium]
MMARKERKPSRLLIPLVMLLFLANACGKDVVREETPPAPTPSEPAEEIAYAEPETAAQSPAPEARIGDDLGEPCGEHHYIVAAGTSANLDFHVLMKREVYELEAYTDRYFSQQDVSVKDGSDSWSDHGVVRGEPGYYLEPVDTYVELWGVRLDELLEKSADDPGKLTTIGQSSGGRRQYKINVTGEGFGLFTRLGNWWPEEKIAQMSDDQVYETLGNRMEVVYTHHRHGSFTFPIERVSVNARSFILTITYDITFPEDQRTRIAGSKLWQVVQIGNSSDAKFTLRFDYDKKRKIYRVYGPWDDARCI